MKCDIIIPIWNQHDFTRRCIEYIRRNTKYPYRLVLIDNNSDNKTRDYLILLARDDKDVLLIRNEENIGFVKAVNQGLGIADAPYVCLMNNDTEASRGWLTEMISVAETSPVIGLVNPVSKIREKSRYKQKPCDRKRYIETNQCMGYCMLIKKEVIDKIGFLDEAFGMGGFDDTDFSKRAHLAGYKCVCAKNAYVYHKWHTSFYKAGNREELVRKNEAIFFRKWGKYMRIAYPISCTSKEGFARDINTSLGLAREWNWVHAWLSADNMLKKDAVFLNLPEHQSLRIFKMAGRKVFFYIGVLFKLIERRLKGRKSFDAVLVSDKRLLRFLSLFRNIFSVPVVFIGKISPSGNGSENTDEEFWKRRARCIMEMVKKERSNEV